MIGYTSWHEVARLSVAFKNVPGATWIALDVTGKDGTFHSINFHVDKPIEIEGADLLALMAATADAVPETEAA